MKVLFTIHIQLENLCVRKKGNSGVIETVKNSFYILVE